MSCALGSSLCAAAAACAVESLRPGLRPSVRSTASEGGVRTRGAAPSFGAGQWPSLNMASRVWESDSAREPVKKKNFRATDSPGYLGPCQCIHGSMRLMTGPRVHRRLSNIQCHSTRARTGRQCADRLHVPFQRAPPHLVEFLGSHTTGDRCSGIGIDGWQHDAGAVDTVRLLHVLLLQLRWRPIPLRTLLLDELRECATLLQHRACGCFRSHDRLILSRATPHRHNLGHRRRHLRQCLRTMFVRRWCRHGIGRARSGVDALALMQSLSGGAPSPASVRA